MISNLIAFVVKILKALNFFIVIDFSIDKIIRRLIKFKFNIER